ncbi:hypothetical protein ACFWBB_31960 [Streptomyces sp. NPDC060000]
MNTLAALKSIRAARPDGAPIYVEPARLAVAAPVRALLGCHAVSVTPR